MAPTITNRQNEYFVPRDGIDREVITADICRYLGNDALVRPGTYEDPNTRQAIQGYFINAYRNLTTAMIDDLKADSARWDQERRQQQSARNTSGVQYRFSETHNDRQQHGPTPTEAAQAASYGNNSRDFHGDSDRRYPGTGSSGYSGATGGFSGSQYPPSQAGYGGQPGYPAQSPPYGSQSNAYAGHSGMTTGFPPPTQGGAYTIGGNSVARGDTRGDVDMFGASDYSTRGSVPVTTMPPSRGTYTSASPSAPTQGYPGSSHGYYQPPPSNSGAYPVATTVQAIDPYYGRAGPGSYSQEPQYESTPAPSRTPTGPTGTVPPSSSSSRRDDRHSVDRDSRRSHHTSSRR